MACYNDSVLTIPNALAPSGDEHAIVSLLSDSLVHQIVDIQKELQKRLGDVLWVPPTNCLHITLMEIICNADYGKVPRMQLFSEWYGTYGTAVKEVIEQYATFTLEFSDLYVSPAAIIITASDPSPLNSIRSALLANIKLPDGTKQPPRIAHTTIARFMRAVELEDVQAAAQPLQRRVTESIKAFKLIKGLGPPDFNPKEIANYPLKDAG